MKWVVFGRVLKIINKLGLYEGVHVLRRGRYFFKEIMSLSKEQLTVLLGMVTTVELDDLDCGECLGQVSEFAELHLSKTKVPEAINAVQVHLEQCDCCEDEFNALLKGLTVV